MITLATLAPKILLTLANNESINYDHDKQSPFFLLSIPA